jgi:cytochrome c peroxidase
MVNAAKAELGKRLFFDRRLSGDAAISCASCHQPDKAFTDGLALSAAYPGSKGFRNTPTLMNTALRKNWFHDGRLGTNLNDVTRESLTEDYSMNMDMRLMQERVKQDPVYVEMFEAAGFGEPSNGGIRNARDPGIPEYADFAQFALRQGRAVRGRRARAGTVHRQGGLRCLSFRVALHR